MMVTPAIGDSLPAPPGDNASLSDMDGDGLLFSKESSSVGKSVRICTGMSIGIRCRYAVPKLDLRLSRR